MSEGNEKSSKFMNWFWDLASDDDSRRCIAASMIVKYVAETQKKVETANTMSVDGDYTLKRLVRGLSSSRDSARQGFSACLCQFLAVFPNVDITEVLNLLDETTKNTGAMRGSEERDVMFGRLFGYLALIRSGRLRNDSANSLLSLDRLIGLHKRKAWIREVVSEGILFLLEEMPSDVATMQSVSKKLSEILFNEGSDYVDIAEISAHEIVLVSGLQSFCLLRKDLPAGSANALRGLTAKYTAPPSLLLSPTNLPVLAPTLLAACGGFPKVHRVWYSLLMQIFGSSEFRCLPTERLESLAASEQALLTALMTFIETHLIPMGGGSHEKKGVALKLILELVRLVPVALLPVVLSQRVVRTLVSIRGNNKHTLFELAGATLQELVRIAGSSSGDSSLSRLAISNSLVLHGGAMFDSRTNSTTVSELLQSLDVSQVLSHVKSLCRMIATTSKSSNEDKDEEDEDTSGSIASAVAAVNALFALAKNPQLSSRGTICSVVIAVLLRLSCFGPGATSEATVDSESGNKKKGKTPKKKSKVVSSDAESSLFTEWGVDADLARHMVSAVHQIESNTQPSCYLEKPEAGESVSAVAGNRLLALLADMGHMGVLELDEGRVGGQGQGQPEEGKPPQEAGQSLLHIAMAILLHIAKSMPLRINLDQDEEVPQQGGNAAELRQTLSTVKLLGQSTGVAPRLVASLDVMICQAAFHVYCSESVDPDCLEELCRVVPLLISAASGAKEDSKPNNKEDSDDDDEDESLQTKLFAVCMDLLAVPGDHSVKGIRDAIKRAWNSVMQHCAPDSDVAEAILLAVIGNDVQEEADVDELEDGLEGVNVDEESEEESEGDDSEGEEEEEDVMLGHDDMMELLNTEEGDDDDEDGEIAHHEGADAALGQLIQMKKQNRKKGLLLAKRQELIVRSRAIDILEVFLHRNENALLLLPMFRPLLFCLKKVSASSLSKSLQEGRTFQQRLRSVIESKLSKTKLVYERRPDDEEEIAFLENVAGDCLVFCGQCLRAADPALRQVAIACFVCVARSVIAGHIGGMTALQEIFSSCVSEYFNRKNTRVPVKLVDDMVNRFPDFVVTSSLNVVIEAACEDAKSNFLRAEAFRVLTNILKKFSSLTSECKQAIVSSVSSMVDAVVGVVSSDVTSDIKAKRVKPILVFAKDLIQFLKTHQHQEEAAAAFAAAAPAIQKLKATFTEDSELAHLQTAVAAGSTVHKLFAQACTAASGLEVGGAASKATGRKKRGPKTDAVSGAKAAVAVNDVGSKKQQKKHKRRNSFDGDEQEEEALVDYERELVKLARKGEAKAEAAANSKVIKENVVVEVSTSSSKEKKKVKKQRK